MNTYSRFLFFLVPVTLLLLSSCRVKEPADLSFFTRALTVQNDNSLSGKLFFVGPIIDSIKVEIQAPCDCCASNLAFLNDSVFIYQFMCMEGDDYIKGNYVKAGNAVAFRFNGSRIRSTRYLGTDKEETFEKLKAEVFFSVLKISELKGNTVLTYSNGGASEYAMENRKVSLKKYIKELKEDGVLENNE